MEILKILKILKKNELALRRYSQQSDFRRDIIKGSIRAQRRKTVTWKFFKKGCIRLFLDKIEKSLFFFDTFKSMKIFEVKNLDSKKTEFKILGYIEEKQKKSEKRRKKKKRK